MVDDNRYTIIIIQIIDFITPFIADAPGLTEGQKFWVPKIFSMILIIYKFWTNTKKQELDLGE